jgi:hypothetical protein
MDEKIFSQEFLQRNTSESTDDVWSVRRERNARVLRLRESQPLVCSGICGVVPLGIGLWLSPRCVALRLCGRSVVSYCSSALVANPQNVLSPSRTLPPAKLTIPKLQRDDSNTM